MFKFDIEADTAALSKVWLGCNPSPQHVGHTLACEALFALHAIVAEESVRRTAHSTVYIGHPDSPLANGCCRRKTRVQNDHGVSLLLSEPWPCSQVLPSVDVAEGLRAMMLNATAFLPDTPCTQRLPPIAQQKQLPTTLLHNLFLV